MCLSTGGRIIRDRWTDLPMPREVIQRVTEMGRQQGMPATLTFADRHGRELEDRLVEIPDDDDTQEAYDPYYDGDSTHTGDDDLSYNTDDDGDDDDNDGHPAPVPGINGHGIAVAPDPHILDNDPALFGPNVPPVTANEDQHSLTDSSHDRMEALDDIGSTGVVDTEVDEHTVEMDDINNDDSDASTGVEDDVISEVNDNTGVGDNIPARLEADTDDESSADEDPEPTTESSKFQQAVTDGITRAYDENGHRPP